MRILSSILLFAAIGQVSAHAPYVAPYQFIVGGGNTPIIAGFAEGAFDTEVAIRGFDFLSFNPKGESQVLNMSNIHSVSMSNLAIAEEGTYQILGKREEKIKYANLDGRWLRVLDPKGAALSPLAEREFITESELKTDTDQVTVTRFDELLTYLTKNKTSALKPITPSQVQLVYSVHPNELKKSQPLDLTVTLKDKPAVQFEVKVEQKIDSLKKKEWSFDSKTDLNGEVRLNFPDQGEYIVTILSPQGEKNAKPIGSVYRTVISLAVRD